MSSPTDPTEPAHPSRAAADSPLNSLLKAAETHFRSGRPAQAKQALEDLIRIDGSSSRAFELLGYVHGNAGDLAEAHRCLERACQLPGASAEAHYYLGVSMLRQGLDEPAILAFDRAMAMVGPFYEALHERATACSRLGRNREALQGYEQARRMRPESFGLLFNIGKVHDALKDFGNALAHYDRALALDPQVADAWAHRGAALYDLGRYAEAAQSWQRALAIDPTIEHLRGFVQHARLRLCDWQDWQVQRQDLLDRVRRGEDACGPFEMLAISGDESLQLSCAQRWMKDPGGAQPQPEPPPASTASPTPPAPPAPTVPPERQRIRIGYFSADFGHHAVSYLIAELCERHDREGFETYAFALKRAAETDDMRARLAAAFDHFIDVADQPDGQIVRQARSLGLDIAIDLGGHTRGSRTAIFRERVAPVQVNFLGYPGSMGVGFMDYLIADRRIVPEASLQHCSESVVWLPDCFQPSDTRRRIADVDPQRSAWGLPETGFVFCCFNNTYKINPDTFDVWMRILRAVPGTCLWLLADQEPARANLRREAERRGVDPQRLVFGGRLPVDQYLGRFRLADLFLDTLPFNGGTTANDALFAGLPLLTCEGTSFAGRMAASLLHALGMPEGVVASIPEYEERAIRWATHPQELQALRDRLQLARESASLFDMPRYTRHFEQACREMVRRSRLGLPRDHIRVAPLPD